MRWARLGAGAALAAVCATAGRPQPSAAQPSAAGSPPAPAAPGQPLAGLTPAERARFERGREAFETAHSIETGLGPLFNDSACNRCHNLGGVGGAGFKSSRLIGRRGDGGQYDDLSSRGGPVLASASVTLEASAGRLLPNCHLSPEGEPTPPEANVVARRRTPPLFGLGLVDATPEAVFVELARRQPPSIRGRLARVRDPATGRLVLGRFGWKAQSPSLHHFSGLALVVELGVTNPAFPDEQPPLGSAAEAAGCDLVAGLEESEHGVRHLTDFVSLLSPVAPLSRSQAAREGSALFSAAGCSGCHVRRLRSGPSPVRALSEQEYFPYSDFLLHDMGSLGDGIRGEGSAGPREMRTAPLWGMRAAGPRRLLHDGRAHSLEEAIAHHDGQGAAARDAFARLSDERKAKLVAFLQTL